jgi:hypothetical protein
MTVQELITRTFGPHLEPSDEIIVQTADGKEWHVWDASFRVYFQQQDRLAVEHGEKESSP